MIITLALVLFAVLALLFLIRLAKGHVLEPAAIDAAHPHIHPVDVDAFRNLIDPTQEDFLRMNLPAAEFRSIQRERLRAALDYISCAAQNAAILVRVGEAARRSPDASIAEAGEKLVDTAIRLRLYAFQARAKLYVAIAFPGARISASGLAENYERMTRLVFVLGRLQTAGQASVALS
jgi:hypothetical protein